jgi:hypothetical protein
LVDQKVHNSKTSKPMRMCHFNVRTRHDMATP